jgi:hypothetical protein
MAHYKVKIHSFAPAIFPLLFVACLGCGQINEAGEYLNLSISQPSSEKLEIVLEGHDSTLLIQHVGENKRPYIHPIKAPDGQGFLTEFQPSHHLHQTGLYWGLKEVNGRDFFMNWEADHWRRVDAQVLEEAGERVSWETHYEMLGEEKEAVMREKQLWEFSYSGSTYVMDLLWTGEALKELVMGEFYVGGLFLRMPWYKGIEGKAVNAAGQENQEAEQQRSIWLDLGLKVDGRQNLAHMVIFDHPDNPDFPVPWRVDGELGVGPSRQILGDWHLAKGEKVEFRYRLFCYTGEFDRKRVMEAWKKFVRDY